MKITEGDVIEWSMDELVDAQRILLAEIYLRIIAVRRSLSLTADHSLGFSKSEILDLIQDSSNKLRGSRG